MQFIDAEPHPACCVVSFSLNCVTDKTQLQNYMHYRYLEHSTLQIPRALPPVGWEGDGGSSLVAAATAVRAVSDEEWKELLGKLVSPASGSMSA